MPPRLSRALYAFLIFLLVGPMAGALAFGLLVTAVTLATEPDIGLTFLYAAIVFAPLAYLTGGVQAAFTGAVAGAAILRQGRAPLWIVLGAALVAGAFHAARAHEDWWMTAIMLAVHLVAALACWFVVRLAQTP